MVAARIAGAAPDAGCHAGRGRIGGLSAWLASRASEREAIRRVVGQQTEEVEVMARLLASKIEQSQKVLRTVADGITPEMLNSPSSLEWLLQQGLPAVQFFDSMQVARQDGELRVNLHSGRLEEAANLDPAERDALRRTLTGGKPLVSELVGGAHHRGAGHVHHAAAPRGRPGSGGGGRVAQAAFARIAAAVHDAAGAGRFAPDRLHPRWHHPVASRSPAPSGQRAR